MTARKPHQRPAFSDVVAALPPADTASSSVRFDRWYGASEFHDDEGNWWGERGSSLEGKALWRRVKDPSVRVVLEYFGREEIAPDEREAFCESALKALRDNPYADFSGQEYTNDAGEHLLVVSESC